MSEPKYVNLDTVSIACLSIWTVLGATPVPIFWIFVLCQLLHSIHLLIILREITVNNFGMDSQFEYFK